MIIEHTPGGFRFLRGIAPYSSGAAAAAGHSIIHATLARPAPYRKGFERIDRHLREHARPPQALCGIELRSPRQFTFAGFDQFNRGYIELLRERGLLLDGLNPVARTNVAPEVAAPAEVLLYGFSYSAPEAFPQPTFVIAGTGELTGERLDARDIVRRGDVSAQGLREKASQVLRFMDQRMRELGVGWEQATAVGIYSVHDVFALMRPLLLPRLGPAAVHGVRWHFSRPPIEEIEFEMDVRGCSRELVLPA